MSFKIRNVMKARQLGVLVCIVVNMLLCSVGIVQGDEAIEQADVLQTIKGFYLWAIKHGKDAVALEPVIKDVPHSNRFYLDVFEEIPEQRFFLPGVCSGSQEILRGIQGSV
jgi:hypothetical protein